MPVRRPTQDAVLMKHEQRWRAVTQKPSAGNEYLYNY